MNFDDFDELDDQVVIIDYDVAISWLVGYI